MQQPIAAPSNTVSKPEYPTNRQVPHHYEQAFPNTQVKLRIA